MDGIVKVKIPKNKLLDKYCFQLNLRCLICYRVKCEIIDNFYIFQSCDMRRSASLLLFDPSFIKIGTAMSHCLYYIKLLKAA